MTSQGLTVMFAPATKETSEHCAMVITPVAAQLLTARIASTQAFVAAEETSAMPVANPWRH